MLTGILAGLTWAAETVTIGIALSLLPGTLGNAAFLAPFIATFLHDAFSALCMWVLNGVRGELGEVFKIFKTKDFKWLVLASAIGGPIGMTGYILAVNYMGASVGAIASAVYPAVGSVLAFFFLKEKIRPYQWVFIALTLLGVLGISYSPSLNIKSFWLGLAGAFMCAFGWGAEGVVLSKALKNNSIKTQHALLIRQTSSGLIYGVLVLPLLGAYRYAGTLFTGAGVHILGIICLAGLFATVSYLFYYKAISRMGVAKAMSLNITYTAWSLVLSAAVTHDYSALNPVTIGCGALVVVCGILTATDFKKLKA